MNADRRATAQVCIELIKECAEIGEMTEPSHKALEEAVTSMRKAEYWSLRNQTPHAGKNATTDGSLAISRVALPALEAAELALASGDYNRVVDKLELAASVTAEQAKATPKHRRAK